MPNRPRIAILDIGSNSVRMVVFAVPSHGEKPIFSEKVACGLGRDLDRTGRLNPEGVILALEAISGFTTLTRAMKVEPVIALGTAALREASDSQTFLQRVLQMTGITIQVISGDEEARLSALGVMNSFQKAKGIVGDLGGGSLELARIANNQVHERLSLPLGVLRIDSPAQGHHPNFSALDALPKILKDQKNFYAVGGTWRALASAWLASQGKKRQRLHGLKVSSEKILPFLLHLTTLSAAELIDRLDVDEDRAPFIPAAAGVMLETLRALKTQKIIFSTTSLRDGVLVGMVKI
jgi:exopolyphosphatase/guanosine-5'-triphosphate,3'-diphosphate pyrophosphatase